MPERRETPGEVLRRFRQEKGISQEELASRLGVTQAMVSRLESGRRRVTNAISAKLVDIFVDINKELLGALTASEKTRPDRVPGNMLQVPLLTHPEAILGNSSSTHKIYVPRVQLGDVEGHRLIALTIPNRSGEPDVRPGAVIVVDATKKEIGRTDTLYAVAFSEIDVVLRRGGKKMKPTEVLGRVIWVGQPL